MRWRLVNAGGTADINLIIRPGIQETVFRDFFYVMEEISEHHMERRNEMANVIDDETIEYVGILAKLEISDEEKEQAKRDMGRMLDYIDKLDELDTAGVEPL